MLMIDTTDGPDVIRRITPSPQAVAGYINGRFTSGPALFQAFPHAHHVSIAVSSDVDADCLDIEPGNTEELGRIIDWIRRQHAPRPILYFDLSDGVRVMNGLAHAGITHPKDFRIWAANPTGQPHQVSPGAFPGWVWHADATQFAFNPRRINVDLTLCSDTFFTPEKPNDPYALFFDTSFRCLDPRTHKEIQLNERRTVKAFDEAIVHPLHDPEGTVRLWYDLVSLRKRVWAVAHRQREHGKPSWDVNRRGRRWQQLDHRTHGLL